MLPYEILFDLLSRLPAKSIGRFRCASKPWRSLLSQPEFIKQHLNRYNLLPREKKQEESLILVSDDSLYSIQLKNDSNFEEMTVLAKKLSFDGHRFSPNYLKMATCDGLILVKDVEGMLLLINPTTREIKVLPSSPYNDSRFFKFGLGYDSANDDYKVVTFTNDSVNVYSVRNGTWKNISDSSHHHFDLDCDSSVVFVNGFFHSVVDYEDIVAFDLEEEKFSEVPLMSFSDTENSEPDDSDDTENNSEYDKEFEFSNLVELGGCLAAFPESITDTCHSMFVGVMKEYGVQESWIKIPVSETGSNDSMPRPLCLLGEGQMVMVMNEDNPNLKFVVYNMKEEAFKNIVVHGIPNQFSVEGSFFESLVSPHCSDEAVAEQ